MFEALEKFCEEGLFFPYTGFPYEFVKNCEKFLDEYNDDSIVERRMLTGGTVEEQRARVCAEVCEDIPEEKRLTSYSPPDMDPSMVQAAGFEEDPDDDDEYEASVGLKPGSRHSSSNNNNVNNMGMPGGGPRVMVTGGGKAKPKQPARRDVDDDEDADDRPVLGDARQQFVTRERMRQMAGQYRDTLPPAHVQAELGQQALKKRAEKRQQQQTKQQPSQSQNQQQKEQPKGSAKTGAAAGKSDGANGDVGNSGGRKGEAVEDANAQKGRNEL